MIIKGITLFYFLTFATISFCQTQTPSRLVPLEMANIRFEDSYIKVTYSRPDMNGRKIFGELIPFSKIWTPGQNESAEIILTRDILINEDTLDAGAYSIFIIPSLDRWIVIFNTEVGQWGTYHYNEKFNAIEFEVPVTALTDTHETLTIEFDNKGKKETSIRILWEYTLVEIPIVFQNPLE